MGIHQRKAAAAVSHGTTEKDAVAALKAAGKLPEHDPKLPGPFPLEKPPFTLKEIRDAVPAHCFERSYLTSFSYLAADLLKTGAVYGVAYGFEHYAAPQLPAVAPYAFWPIWWYVIGCQLTGLWVLAHECGHHAFSPSEWVNDVVGWVLHSALLVPYHAWRVTHGKHHSNTGSADHDEVFVPHVESDMGDAVKESPLASLLGIVFMLTVGWPGYLIMNVAGPRKYRGQIANHFDSRSVFFRKRDYWGVLAGNVGVLGMLALLFVWGHHTSFATVFKWYLVPYLWVNQFLVLITYLQHTDVYVPHFRGEEWSWLRGALCTVDRSFGSLLDHTFHHIADLHVCHHIFSKMPFYHHEEATEAFKPIIGKYYLRDPTPIVPALWRSWTRCKYVDDEDTVVFYNS